MKKFLQFGLVFLVGLSIRPMILEVTDYKTGIEFRGCVENKRFEAAVECLHGLELSVVEQIADYRPRFWCRDNKQVCNSVVFLRSLMEEGKK